MLNEVLRLTQMKPFSRRQEDGKQMLVYVASPVRPVFDACMTNGEALQWILDYAKIGCKAVKKMGFLPISPILAFDGVYDEFTERERIDEACEKLLLTCNAIYVVDTPFNKDSKGIARELEIAEKNGIKILGEIR